ncbi:hypothetical protein OQA88_7162 [Cercophora sp. LCS_1]
MASTGGLISTTWRQNESSARVYIHYNVDTVLNVLPDTLFSLSICKPLVNLTASSVCSTRDVVQRLGRVELAINAFAPSSIFEAFADHPPRLPGDRGVGTWGASGVHNLIGKTDVPEKEPNFFAYPIGRRVGVYVDASLQ